MLAPRLAERSEIFIPRTGSEDMDRSSHAVEDPLVRVLDKDEGVPPIVLVRLPGVYVGTGSNRTPIFVYGTVR